MRMQFLSRRSTFFYYNAREDFLLNKHLPGHISQRSSWKIVVSAAIYSARSYSFEEEEKEGGKTDGVALWRLEISLDRA